MKTKLLCIAALLLATAGSLFAQTTGNNPSSTGNITAAGANCFTTNACIMLFMSSSYTSISVTTSGTFSMTLKPEQTNDGVNWSSAGTDITTATLTTYTVAAMTGFRIRASAVVSGTVTVNIVAGGAISVPGTGSGGGITSVSTLPGTCTPGVTAPVTLSVPPYGIYFCGPNVNQWTSTSDILKAVSCVGCKADAEAVSDATVTNGSANVTTSGGDIAFTSNDNNKACFATSSGGPAIAHIAGKLSMAQGTFTFTSAHAGTCTTANANATGAANNYFLWGTDDASALTTWWTAINPTGGLCLSGVLPGTPFMTSTNFGSATTSVCNTPITGTGHEGINVTGFGQLTSLMIILPAFITNAATLCVGGPLSDECLFASNGDSLYNFGIWGGEYGNCAASINGKSLLGINVDTHIVNVELLGLCGAVSGGATTSGLKAEGASGAQQAGIIVDGMGSTCLTLASQNIPITNSWFGDCLSDVSISANMFFTSNDNTFGDVGAGQTMVTVAAGGFFISSSDTCFNSSANNMVGVKVLAGGTAILTNMVCNISVATTSVGLWANGAAARINSINGIFGGGSAAQDLLVDNATGVFLDISNNTFLRNRISTAVPCNYWTGNTIGCVGLTAQTNNIGATTIVTSPTQIGAAQGPNLYTAYYHINVVVAGTSGTITLNLICNNGTATFTQPGPTTVAVTATAGTEVSGIITCHAASASTVQYSTTGIVTPGTLSYTLDVKLRPS